MRPVQIDLNLPPQLVQELTDSFTFFDRNGDGKISKEELGTVVRSLGQKVSDADLDKLMSDVDANGDGYIDLQEFIDLNARAITESCSPMDEDSLQYGGGVAQDAMRSAFNVFDVDQNGFISAEELHRVLVGFGDEKVSLEDCRSMIQCVDADGDHMINFREFEALMSGMCVL
jgi:calcium-binding protein CML